MCFMYSLPEVEGDALECHICQDGTCKYNDCCVCMPLFFFMFPFSSSNVGSGMTKLVAHSSKVCTIHVHGRRLHVLHTRGAPTGPTHNGIWAIECRNLAQDALHRISCV